jgi:hypothetical protein
VAGREAAARRPQHFSGIYAPTALTKELRLPVGLLNPHPKFSVELSKVATFKKSIRKGPLAASQFPDVIRDARGDIRKPAGC